MISRPIRAVSRFAAHRTLACTLLAASLACIANIGTASAVTPVAHWQITSTAEPTRFAPNDGASRCDHGGVAECDTYLLTVTNTGALASSPAESITITDTLPAGAKLTDNEKAVEGDEPEGEEEANFRCPVTPEATSATCTLSGLTVAAGQSIFVQVRVVLEASVVSLGPNSAVVSGGGASEAGVVEAEPPVVSAATPPFEVTHFSFEVDNAAGEPALQAGEHPYSVSASFDVSSVPKEGELSVTKPAAPVQDPKEVEVDLPLGLVGDPQATATRCAEYEVVESTDLSGCPASSEVGRIVINNEGLGHQSEALTPIYNIVPQPGHPAEFAFAYVGKPVFVYASLVHTSAGYDLRVGVPGIPGAVGTEGATLTFFGDPAEHNGGTSPSTAFLRNATSCLSGAQRTARIEATGWAGGVAEPKQVTLPALEGCNALSFAPSFAIEPEATTAGSTTADTPAPYEVVLKVPQDFTLAHSFLEEGAATLATADLRDATVTLPAGVAVSPSAAEGLAGCSLAQLDLESNEPGKCPSASNIGTVSIKTPLLGEEELTGAIHLAEPQCGKAGQAACTVKDAEEGKIFGLYLEAESPTTNVNVKLVGSVTANGQTGQLTAHFNENPQLPFSELRLHFNSGARAPLSNPQTCGTYTTDYTLEPWSAPAAAAATGTSSFQVTGCDGFPFNPGFVAGTTQTAAGTHTAFTLSFARNDGEQDLSKISVALPSGLLGTIAGIPRCDEAQANAGTCSAASQIGTTTVAAGSGSHPLYLSGKVYLTDSYEGQPFGLSVVVPAVAGPFNLGDVVVRASIAVNPSTAALTVTSGALPQIVDGVPVRLQKVNVDIDRAGFMLNPTNCSAKQIAATISSAQGSNAAVSTPFAASGCKDLPFSPKLTASTKAYTSPKQGSALNVKIAYQSGQANIKRVDVTLPHRFSARLEPTLNEACSETQFAANPAGCPEDSFAGTAKAVTPLLSAPLEGPAIFVSHGGKKFPDLDLVLQGEGVTIILTGNTEIKGKITYSRFETVPDAPISSFELSLPEGAHSALAPNLPKRTDRSFCGRDLVMPTTIEGQNGAIVKQQTKVAIEGCKPALTIVSHKVKGDTATIKVKVPSAGKLTASGNGLISETKKASKAKLITLKLRLRKAPAAKHAKVKTKIKVAFKPKQGHKLTKKLKLEFKT